MAALNPAKMSADQLASAFTKAGTKVSAKDVEQDVSDGAPTNADGTLHLVHYTAWLASQVK